ncbi:ABC transporter ATP-binding protein [Desulfosarcina ovata subsp. sediminis]|uniref:ABC transporter ATP-binding protein n=1 Tax=Desulfosarcina ovata subsp. sediminis TaxID=885957 RepID=A0A5K7ZT66_9BACT|nr:ABC transporter ATP-binding protein [Desulfosarcina ovata]BBO83399.1 ABC transporter ATP-binding protein [Desulfosarcina ovata subsp. sediminis]
MPLIEAENLSYTYPAADRKALDRLSLQIEQGEFVAVIGANNSGKTSLCLALTGVIPHLYHGRMQGRMRVCGMDTAEANIAKICSSSVALVMQKPENQLSGVRFTVREEVAFSLENQGMGRDEMQERVQAMLRMTGLTHLADRSPHHLSGGQLQKVALAAALVGDAPIVVLDEPTTFLDPLSARQVFEILYRLRRQGKTIVLAEQRLEMIAIYANRVIALNNGEKILDGPPAEILVSPILKEIGLGWTRFTTIADLARAKGIWHEGSPLATTLAGTINGLRRD